MHLAGISRQKSSNCRKQREVKYRVRHDPVVGRYSLMAKIDFFYNIKVSIGSQKLAKQVL